MPGNFGDGKQTREKLVVQLLARGNEFAPQRTLNANRRGGCLCDLLHDLSEDSLRSNYSEHCGRFIRGLSSQTIEIELVAASVHPGLPRERCATRPFTESSPRDDKSVIKNICRGDFGEFIPTGSALTQRMKDFECASCHGFLKLTSVANSLGC